MKHLALIAALALPLALSAPLSAQDAPATPASVVASAAPEDWVAIAPRDMLIMELASAASGSERRVVIQLMPPPFSQPWVANIRALARAHWWDGTSVYRVVDNWVAQWGDVSEEKPLPEGVASPVADYGIPMELFLSMPKTRLNPWPSDPGAPERPAQIAPASIDELAAIIRPKIARTGQQLARGMMGDSYAAVVAFSRGFPFAQTINADGQFSTWPIHCYGSVGVARDLAPDTGTGSELYAVIGHAPRQLDRNIAAVGRVIEGIEYLSTLPRGTGEAGVYEDRWEDTAILSVRLASELSDPPAFEYLDTSSASFARYVAVRANRNDAFYIVPAGGVDVCNVQVPVRLQE